MDLGEVVYNLASTNPSGCGVADGLIAISGLNGNVNYTITYNYGGSPVSIMQASDGSGVVTLSLLPAGIYNTLVVTEDTTGCTDNLGQVELLASPLMVNINQINPLSCGAVDGSIIISGLNTNLDYTITYNYGGSPLRIIMKIHL